MKIFMYILRLAALVLILMGVCHLVPFVKEESQAAREYREAGDQFTSENGEGDDGSRRSTGIDTALKKEGDMGERSDGPVRSPGLKINPPEDAKAPLTVNWKDLKAVNPDVIGWLFMDGDPDISYPILQGETNDTYLHTTYQGTYLYAGSIFLNATSSPDLSDPSSYLFGHNMRSGSMFGRLKYLMTQESWDAHPFFWILTPQGDYRYRIFAAITTTDGSDAYILWKEHGQDFKRWGNALIKMSVIDTDTKIYEEDFIVGLSTCQGSGTQYRNVIFGVLVSTARPGKKGEECHEK